MLDLAEDDINKLRGHLLNTARKKGVNQTDAEDLAQEVLLELQRYEGPVRDFTKLATTILNRRFIDFLRKKNSPREKTVTRELEKIAWPEHSYESSNALKNTPQDNLDATIERLTPRRKHVIDSLYFKCMTPSEVAAETGTTPRTIEKRKRDALSAMRRDWPPPATGRRETTSG